MRSSHVRIASVLIAGALLASTSDALAQDSQFLIPDILLLVDTSGSMGLTTFRENGQFVPPKCGTWAAPKPVTINASMIEDAGHSWTAPDRWMMIVRALTGTVNNMACVAQQRTDPLFAKEFALGNTPATGLAPIDTNNFMPYNRIVARPAAGTSCTPAPSWKPLVRAALLNNAFAWPNDPTEGGPIFWREVGDFSGVNNACQGTFNPQDEDGIIDQYRDLARFGLMTFDPMPYWNDSGTKKVGIGVQGGSNNALYTGGIADTWSYFENWWTDNAPVPAGAGTGNLGGCDSQTAAGKLWEVGARNPAAPPWEGRLIPFGPINATPAEIAASNDRVQQALLAARPFGQTPIAGMLEDAKTFLLKDAETTSYVGGFVDKSFTTSIGLGCRKRRVILVTDGAPNYDLRPGCEYTTGTPPVAGKCPYAKSEDTAEFLKNNNIPVYVIGLSVSNGADTCKTLFTNNPNVCNTLTACDSSCAAKKCAYGYCINDAAQEALAQCCVVEGIAIKGGTQHARFVETQGELTAAVDDIVKLSTNENSSRTVPVFAGFAQVSGQSITIPGARFYSSFKPETGQLLAGSLNRHRYTCPAPVGTLPATLVDIEASSGDKFDENVNGPSGANRATRMFYTVVGDDTTGKIYSERSIRPWYKPPSGQGDRLGTYGVKSTSDPNTKMVSGIPAAIKTNVDPLAILGGSGTCGVTGCCFPTPSQPAPTADQCRDRFLDMQFGLPVAGNPDITFKRTSAFGASVHSPPVVVSPPSDLIRDDSYVSFQKSFGTRPNVLYSVTVDGQLHAFNMTKLDNTLNEMWSFMPPAVLSMLNQEYPDRYHAKSKYLLDGPIVVRNVAGTAFDTTTGRFLTRTNQNAITPADVRWYTILLGSFGAYGGYYALDVSWPDQNSTLSPPTGYTKGPRFLWQLTTDEFGSPIFGDRAGVPSIATLYFSMPGSSDPPAEHAVAILPGGNGGQPTNTSIARTYSISAVDGTVTPSAVTRKYLPVDASSDQSVRSFGGARSITIVRLDTGEVVRTLRYGPVPGTPAATDKRAPQGLYDAGRIGNAPFDAPIVGQLVSYPAGAGSVADRGYVGDAEGHLWRLDLSNPDPTKWAATMFFDAYPTGGLGLDGIYTWQSASPIQTPPVVSIDTIGRVTLAFSTGGQDDISADGRLYNVWSLTEVPVGNTATSKVNWYLNHLNATDSNVPVDPLPDPNPPQGLPTPDPPTPTRFAAGERVFGPLSLFNSKLYFTTYDPKSASKASCRAGYSYVWGVHYINAGKNANANPTSAPADGPFPEWKNNPTDLDKDRVRYFVQNAGSIAFGVGISQQPACISFGAPSVVDSALAFGATHSSMSTITPGPFQVVVQSGKTVGGSDTKVTAFNLAQPPGGSVIDSWAAIVE
ncbi:MAG: hypothetical protein HY898_31060 [Deltaproteobacteria bacterium]|nr:hypothetical protein [Deltaproteobacteria bacterium]